MYLGADLQTCAETDVQGKLFPVGPIPHTPLATSTGLIGVDPGRCGLQIGRSLLVCTFWRQNAKTQVTTGVGYGDGVMPDTAPARGRLVVATPELRDPNFEGSVVLLLEHDDQGTLGVVLNRPSHTLVEDAMSSPPSAGGDGAGWNEVAVHPAVVFVGGPVRPNALIALAQIPQVIDSRRWQPLVGDLGVVSLSEGPISQAGSVAALRLFIGYAGWGPGQLQDEVDGGSWFVVDTAAEDTFSAQPEDLWRTVLRRQGGVFVTATTEPVLN